MVEAYRRALVCTKALKEIYEIDIALPAIAKNGYLNALALWAQESADKLGVLLDNRTVSEVAFSLSAPAEDCTATELLKRSAYEASFTIGAFHFAISENNFAKFGIGSPLLQSLRIFVESKDDLRIRAWSAVVTPPTSPLSGSRFPCMATTNFVGSGQENSAFHGIHNLNPLGNWALTLGARAITGEANTSAEIKNIGVIMTVSHRFL